MNFKLNKRHEIFYKTIIKIIENNGDISKQEIIELILKTNLYSRDSVNGIYNRLYKTGIFERFTKEGTSHIFWRLKNDN